MGTVDNKLIKQLIVDYELILQTYNLLEILEWNNITEEEALAFMVDNGLLILPDPKPVDTII